MLVSSLNVKPAARLLLFKKWLWNILESKTQVWMEAQIPGPEESGCGLPAPRPLPPAAGGPLPGEDFTRALQTSHLAFNGPTRPGWLKRKHLVLCPGFAGQCRYYVGVL